ncbi:hypothetical protein [Nostoc sp. XA010]|uniref:hypothetical protein n=1 Tax=Nostoc sp. XA010 TaxID=2780407 RepID=UPI001E45E78D|nr:hypothetical protein [Nostoc sp. XA010]
MLKRLIEDLPFFQMSIVFDYIQKYPSRTKQILANSHQQLQPLLNCPINRHNEIKTKKSSQKIKINAPGGGRPEKLLVSKQVCLCILQ